MEFRQAEQRAAAAPMAAPIGRVLVGFDERSAARDALALGATLAGEHAELLVVSVRAYWPELIGAKEYERVLAADKDWLRRAATRVLGSRPFSTRVVGGGHESDGLKEVALAEGADAIVVGSSHRGALGRVLPGSFGERVLDNAPCAVAIAPRAYAESERRLQTVAVGYDGSRQAAAALELAAGLALERGANLRLLGAVDVRLDTAGLPHSPDEVEEARMRAALDRALATLPEGLETESQLLHGAPQHSLPEAARDADLLVLGSRGHYGRARRLFLGSVAAKLTRSAPVPTLVAPAS